MIVLTIAFCLISTGQCESRRVPAVTYPTIEACQQAGEKMAGAISARIAGGVRVAGTTCAIDPEDPED